MSQSTLRAIHFQHSIKRESRAPSVPQIPSSDVNRFRGVIEKGEMAKARLTAVPNGLSGVIPPIKVRKDRSRATYDLIIDRVIARAEYDHSRRMTFHRHMLFSFVGLYTFDYSVPK